MEKIINGKKYDTETANYICGYEYDTLSVFSHIHESLFRKKDGEFFLYGCGGPNKNINMAISAIEAWKILSHLLNQKPKGSLKNMAMLKLMKKSSAKLKNKMI